MSSVLKMNFISIVDKLFFFSSTRICLPMERLVTFHNYKSVYVSDSLVNRFRSTIIKNGNFFFLEKSDKERDEILLKFLVNLVT